MYISLASGNTSSNRKPEKRGVKSENRQGGTRQQAGGRVEEWRRQKDKHKQRARLKLKRRSRTRRRRVTERGGLKWGRDSKASSLNKCLHWPYYHSLPLTPTLSNRSSSLRLPPPTRHPAIAHSFSVPKYAYEYKTIRTFCGGQKLLHMTLPDKPAASAREKERDR